MHDAPLRQEEPVGRTGELFVQDGAHTCMPVFGELSDAGVVGVARRP